MPRPGTQALVVSRADKIYISALFASSLVRNNISYEFFFVFAFLFPKWPLVNIQLLLFCFPFFVCLFFFLWFHYLIPTSYLVQQLISMYCKIIFNFMRQTTLRPK